MVELVSKEQAVLVLRNKYKLRTRNNFSGPPIYIYEAKSPSTLKDESNMKTLLNIIPNANEKVTLTPSGYIRHKSPLLPTPRTQHQYSKHNRLNSNVYNSYYIDTSNNQEQSKFQQHKQHTNLRVNQQIPESNKIQTHQYIHYQTREDTSQDHRKFSRQSINASDV